MVSTTTSSSYELQLLNLERQCVERQANADKNTKFINLYGWLNTLSENDFYNYKTKGLLLNQTAKFMNDRSLIKPFIKNELLQYNVDVTKEFYIIAAYLLSDASFISNQDLQTRFASYGILSKNYDLKTPDQSLLLDDVKMAENALKGEAHQICSITECNESHMISVYKLFENPSQNVRNAGMFRTFGFLDRPFSDKLSKIRDDFIEFLRPLTEKDFEEIIKKGTTWLAPGIYWADKYMTEAALSDRLQRIVTNEMIKSQQFDKRMFERLSPENQNEVRKSDPDFFSTEEAAPKQDPNKKIDSAQEMKEEKNFLSRLKTLFFGKTKD
jgi:hypothetical protein